MRIMEASSHSTPAKTRRDGWTPERRRRFIELLAAGSDVRRACAGVGMSRESAYRLRRREAEFALAWDQAQRAARLRAEEVFLAMLPERLRRTMSELSGECGLRDAGQIAQDPVKVAARV
jgi:hypothetical protein